MSSGSSELEGVSLSATKIIRGSPETTIDFANSFLQRVISDLKDPTLYSATDKDGPILALTFVETLQSIRKTNPKFKLCYITDICPENVQHVAKLLSAGGVMEIRHISGFKAKFSMSRKEYLATIKSLERGVPDEFVWSNNLELVSEMRSLFQMLWDTAIPAETRMRELSGGYDIGETRIINDPSEVLHMARQIFEESQSEVLLAMPSAKTIQRIDGLFDILSKKADEDGFSARILAPIADFQKENNTVSDERLFVKRLEWKKIEPIDIGFGIHDRKKLLIIQYANKDADSSLDPIVSAIVTTNREMVQGFLSVFDALWRESELRERAEISKRQEEKTRLAEEKSRREAQLLQDILAHDIRNYNQIVLLSAELLKEELGKNESVQSILGSMLDAVDGSTMLLERAKKLGRVISEINPRLYPVDLLKAVDTSFKLVKDEHTEKRLFDDRRPPVGQADVSRPSAKPTSACPRECWVLADDLLQEVFLNLFSNSIRYTQGKDVYIQTLIEEAIASDFQKILGDAKKDTVHFSDDYGSASSTNEFWKVTISDKGRGIPDVEKGNIFARYLRSAKGSGLGMSIVHALVVERYKGNVLLRNRVPSDCKQGDYNRDLASKGN